MKNTNPFVDARIGRVMYNTGGNPNDPPPPPPTDEEIQRAKYEADAAKAEAAKIKQQLDEIKKSLPSDEQRARWAELEQQAAQAEQQRLEKAGEFEKLRDQMNERHQRELEAQRQLTQNESARREQLEREIEDALIGQEFAQATDLFGPSGKTVWFPEVAQAFFRGHVAVESVTPPGGGSARRRVVVKDRHGATIMDPKSGSPMPFAKAMDELIDSHPQKQQILRGSGKVGANSPGGLGGGSGEMDLSRLTSRDFQDPKIREAVRSKMSTAGGLQIGPAFDRARAAKNK
jgi:hypothetical protein